MKPEVHTDSNTEPRVRGCTDQIGREDSCKGRVFIVPIVNVEVFTNLSFAPAIQPHLRPNPTTTPHMDMANGGWRHYGNSRGLRRLKWLFEERLGSSIGRRGAWTAVVNCQAARNEKEVRDALFESSPSSSNFELACHGWDNSTPNNVDGPSLQDEANYIRRCLLDLEAQRTAYHAESGNGNGSRPIHIKVDTWLTPGFKGSLCTAEAAAIAGVKNLLDFCDDDVPYFYIAERMQRCVGEKDHTLIPTSTVSRNEGVLCIPYSMETNDFSLVLEMKHDNRQYAQTLVDHIRQLATEVSGDEGSGDKVVCLGLHTFVAGQPARVNALGEAFEKLFDEFGEERVCFATAKEVGDLWRRKLKNEIKLA